MGSMQILLVDLISIAALLASAYCLLDRPAKKLIEAAGHRMARQAEETALAAEYVKNSDRERRQAVEDARKTMANGVREAGLAFDRMRLASSDLIRQEINRVVQMGMSEL